MTDSQTTTLEWQPIETAPRDGAYRFYGLYVQNRHTGYRWFEAFYVAQDAEGEMLHPSGDNFSDWAYGDFEVWASAPPLPQEASKWPTVGAKAEEQT